MKIPRAPTSIKIPRPSLTTDPVRLVRQEAADVVKVYRIPPAPEPKIGTSWPYRPGYPHDADKRQYHLLEIEGVRHVFMWEPGASLDCMWSAGLYRCTPSVMAKHNYVGVCSPVYRVPTTPSDEETLGMKLRRRR